MPLWENIGVRFWITDWFKKICFNIQNGSWKCQQRKLPLKMLSYCCHLPAILAGQCSSVVTWHLIPLTSARITRIPPPLVSYSIWCQHLANIIDMICSCIMHATLCDCKELVIAGCLWVKVCRLCHKRQ